MGDDSEEKSIFTVPTAGGEGRRDATAPEADLPATPGREHRPPRRRKAVLFITHDLDEAIAMSDRVIVLSAGPATRPIGEFTVDLPRPRDVAEVRSDPHFVALHSRIWAVLREEVLKGYAQQLVKAD